MSKLTYSVLLSCLIVSIFLPLQQLSSQVMQSDTYKIQQDSINIGGGYSTSTSFGMQDTLGEVGTGVSTSTNFSMGAGYQQMNISYISLTNSGDISLPNVSGLAGGIGTDSSTWTVTTDNPAGYSLSVRATTSPAMQSADSYFDDYITGGPDPDYDFAIAATDSAFGFSPEGVDIIQRFRDNGSMCNAGALDTANKCWAGFATTSQTVAERNSSNHPLGSTTTIKYRVESGASNIQSSGAYEANIIVTAITL